MMHACGHDLHTSGLLGASIIIKEISDKGELQGNVLLIFQPSEEKAHQKESGAIKIIKYLEKSGLRDNIDAFIGMHVSSDLQRGEVFTKEGVFLPSSGEIDIELKGPGGSIINAYNDPNLDLIFSELTVRLNKLFKPMAKTGKALVATAGPDKRMDAYNVLLQSQKKTWVVRVFSEDYKKDSNEICTLIKREVKDVVDRHLAEIDKEGGVDIEVKRRPGYRPVVHRDSQLVDVAKKSVKEVIDDYYFRDDMKIFAGEDFSFYLESLRQKRINGIYMAVGAANSKKALETGPLHSSNMKVDNEVVRDLSSIYAQFAVNAIEHYNILKEKI
ncbi:hypothetical protein COX22_02445 [Candidatus Falkowbacteria bacterium CG23_combo_of_CG06-09_8_20_14_all_49_15]|uniref:Peptidase M20 dimerisation domain-containing protein n=1 Tax=Candidatus Falkowbacteria bacterium CG23_combo_of_CG06-09_8_20_14_all_49_15 TaxID=1974572 RepID=A0A2G9ZKV8_9BACT|nr:MAG: hypothetical protein COX22_02445 [Candidatus Falkowbacteria bacterium CG23_combo_of_CG06-09_8_20_14_all_49_15]